MFNGFYADMFNHAWFIFHEDEPGVVVAGPFANEQAACDWLRDHAETVNV